MFMMMATSPMFPEPQVEKDIDVLLGAKMQAFKTGLSTKGWCVKLLKDPTKAQQAAKYDSLSIAIVVGVGVVSSRKVHDSILSVTQKKTADLMKYLLRNNLCISPEHEETAPARQMLNPPSLSEWLGLDALHPQVANSNASGFGYLDTSWKFPQVHMDHTRLGSQAQQTPLAAVQRYPSSVAPQTIGIANQVLHLEARDSGRKSNAGRRKIPRTGSDEVRDNLRDAWAFRQRARRCRQSKLKREAEAEMPGSGLQVARPSGGIRKKTSKPVSTLASAKFISITQRPIVVEPASGRQEVTEQSIDNTEVTIVECRCVGGPKEDADAAKSKHPRTIPKRRDSAFMKALKDATPSAIRQAIHGDLQNSRCTENIVVEDQALEI